MWQEKKLEKAVKRQLPILLMKLRKKCAAQMKIYVCTYRWNKQPNCSLLNTIKNLSEKKDNKQFEATSNEQRNTSAYRIYS